MSRPATGFGHYARDWVYGALDGVTTTLAIVAGALGAGFGNVVAIVLGIANLVADGLSMGAANYLAIKTELEQRGEPVADERPLRHGGVTLAAFALAGGIPLLAFVPNVDAATRMWLASALAGVVLFGVGAARGRFIEHRSWPTLGLEMLVVGAVAGGAAFLVGSLARGWI